MNLFIENLWENPPFFFWVGLMVIFSICCHEFMHAWTALKLGDDTAARRGHLTLNPLRQMGGWSLVMFAFFGLAWGQVPVNPANLKGRRDMVWVSLAGPGTNFVLGLMFTLLSALTFQRVGTPFTQAMLFYGGTLNFVLCVLNLLPVPGLDGWSVVDTLFPRLRRVDSEFMKGTFFIIFMILLLGIGYLFRICGELNYHLLELYLRILR